MNSRSNRLAASILLSGYALVLAASLGKRPLWLDELLPLVATRGKTLPEVLGWVAVNPGGVPLGYVAQWALAWRLIESPAAARLLPAFFSLASAILVFRLGERLGLRQPVLAAALFAVLPLQFRYALEARPYAQAMFFGVAATLLAVRMPGRPSAWTWGAYTLCLTGALYTQPFAFFLVAAHLVWVWPMRAHASRPAALVLLAIVVSLAAFAPWGLTVHGRWRESMAQNGISFHLSARTPLLLLREATGMGYTGTLLLLSLSGLVAARGPLPGETRRGLLAWLLIPVGCALVADAAFGYFVAIRQVLFVLPALALLAAEGFALVWQFRPAWALFLGGVCLAMALAANHSRLTRPGEDWEEAALALQARMAEGGCLAVAPAESLALYEYFAPGLRPLRCAAFPHSENRLVVAITPYTKTETAGRLLRRLRSAGFALRESQLAGGTRIVTFERPPRKTSWKSFGRT